MAIIPRYTSRALPPGAQPGLITGAQSRGEAGAGLARAFGGAVVEGIDYKARRDLAAKTTAETTAAANLARRIAAEKRHTENLDHRNGEIALVAAEAEITKGRARAVASAKTGGAPARDMARISLADFDDTTRKQAEALKTRPHLKARFDAMVESSRAPHELRMLTLENERRAGEEKTVLAAALGELAQAAADDPAMAPGVAGRGLAQIESAMDAGMVTPEEAAAMQGEFADNVHMAAMRGQIAADPALALAKLESGEFNDIFEAPARARLLGEARTTARVHGAQASAAARARRRGLEIDMEEHLAALDESGVADEAVAARARAELPEIQYAAFQQGQAQSRERHATRAEYAFMT
ncbi:MAG: hypothetical protein KAR37_11895, partial [Alphaproteobacteria bacterium]|nr:hypothetical protein [Alphaproteobacteria bacterium]